MEFVDYLKLLRRRAVYLVVALIAGLAGGLAVAASQSTDYSVTVRLYVSSSSTDVAQLLDNVAQVATSAPVITAAAANSPGGATFSVNSETEGGSSVVGIVVASPDAAKATAIATAYAQVLPAAVVKFDPKSGARLQLLDQSGASKSVVHKPRIVALGALIGLLVGFAAALLREALDRSVRVPDELERVLDRPVHAVIPGDRTSSGVALLRSPRSARAEAYRRLSAYVDAVQRPTRTVMVTAALSREGTTATVLNLAAAAAQAGARVIVVDANMRRPGIARSLGEKEDLGLADLLQGRATKFEVIRSYPAGPFGFITAGSPTDQAVELLRSTDFSLLLTELASDHDLVLLDSPGAIQVADAEIIGAECDAVLVVARLGSTPRAQMRRAISVLERAGSPIWGVVANFSGEVERVPKTPKGRATKPASGKNATPAVRTRKAGSAKEGTAKEGAAKEGTAKEGAAEPVGGASPADSPTPPPVVPATAPQPPVARVEAREAEHEPRHRASTSLDTLREAASNSRGDQVSLGGLRRSAGGDLASRPAEPRAVIRLPLAEVSAAADTSAETPAQTIAPAPAVDGMTRPQDPRIPDGPSDYYPQASSPGAPQWPRQS